MKSTARSLGVGRRRCQRSAITRGLLFCSPAKGLMKALIVAVTTAMLLQAAAGAEAPTWSARPVGCIDIRSLWDLIEAQDNHDVSRAAKLMNSSCRSLEGLRYLVESERNGVSRIRIFPRGNDWSTSSVVYTLDEMLQPQEELHLPNLSKAREHVEKSGNEPA